MESPVSIDFLNVSKKYCRNLKRSLRYGIADIFRETIGMNNKDHQKLRKGEFWALKDVSFQIRNGESIGLIGHNGAGKTTILKLINGLIKPNIGVIKVTGSVRALIALGTGFNPILTGRENVLIASAILGYSNKETMEKFEEIVEFSEIGDFIDAPVQTYSSGMLARLGFSVAVHTKPDILLVDEVLAVGDMNFALKCYRKISQFREEGGSIILVSHSPFAIRANCDRAIWLEKGVVQRIGQADEVCSDYESYVSEIDERKPILKYTNKDVELVDIDTKKTINSGDSFSAEFILKCRRIIERPIFCFHVFTVNNQLLIFNLLDERQGFILKQGINKIKVTYPKFAFKRGAYSINVVIAEGVIMNQIAAFINCIKLNIKSDDLDFGSGLFKLEPTWDVK